MFIFLIYLERAHSINNKIIQGTQCPNYRKKEARNYYNDYVKNEYIFKINLTPIKVLKTFKFKNLKRIGSEAHSEKSFEIG